MSESFQKHTRIWRTYKDETQVLGNYRSWKCCNVSRVTNRALFKLNFGIFPKDEARRLNVSGATMAAARRVETDPLVYISKRVETINEKARASAPRTSRGRAAVSAPVHPVIHLITSLKSFKYRHASFLLFPPAFYPRFSLDRLGAIPFGERRTSFEWESSFFEGISLLGGGRLMDCLENLVDSLPTFC